MIALWLMGCGMGVSSIDKDADSSARIEDGTEEAAPAASTDETTDDAGVPSDGTADSEDTNDDIEDDDIEDEEIDDEDIEDEEIDDEDVEDEEIDDEDVEDEEIEDDDIEADDIEDDDIEDDEEIDDEDVEDDDIEDDEEIDDEDVEDEEIDESGLLACPEDEEVFAAHVWEPVLSEQCVLCHVAGGVAGSTELLLDPEDMLASLRAAASVADRLVEKPTGTHPGGHGGGTVIELDSEQADALRFWTDWVTGTCEIPGTAGCEDAPGPRRLWRLTHDEYNNTIYDLLGIDTVHGDTFAADTEVDGHHNDAEALTVSSLLADQYRTAAEDLSSAVDLDDLLPCAPEIDGVATCAVWFIEDFGLQAFRRPLNPTEIERYADFWAEVAEEDGFDEGIRWVLTAMLQSPHFLYRSELGTLDDDDLWTLTDWEIASQLSYLLWGTMPDDTLFEAAAAGTLSSPTQIQDQVTRMAADPRLLERASDFVAAWLELELLESVSREGLTVELRDSMRHETDTLVQEIARMDGTLDDLMLSRATWVDDVLAGHYSMETTGWVTLDGETGGGLLAQGSVLTTHALSTGSSPIHRGVLVRERLLCEDLPPPPPGLDTSPPAVDTSLTTRERYDAHSSDPACASCHEQIDPVGFGFEHYDGLGRYRALEHDLPVDASGSLDGIDFVGVQELSQLLTEDERFRTCFVQTWRRWGTGAESCGDDPGTVGLMEPLLELTERTSFTQRTGEGDGEEANTFATGDRVDGSVLFDIAATFDDLDAGGGSASGVLFELETQTDWGAGYCMDGTVTNLSETPVVWEVSDVISGTISSIWNANYIMDGTEAVFTGVDWNQELDPGTSAEFGFCAER